MPVIAAVAGITAFLAPQLLTVMFGKLSALDAAILVGAISSATNAIAAGGNKSKILENVLIGMVSAGLGNVVSSSVISAQSLAALEESQRILLAQVASSAVSSVPSSTINGGHYFENIAGNVTGSLLSGALPQDIFTKLSPKDIEFLAKFADKATNILIGATPAFIMPGSAEEKLWRYTALAAQLSAQDATTVIVEKSKNNNNAAKTPPTMKKANTNINEDVSVLNKPNSATKVDNKPIANTTSKPVQQPIMPIDSANNEHDISLQDQLKSLQQQKYFIEREETSTYSHYFNEQKYENGFTQAAKEYEKLFAKQQKDSDFYHTQQEKLKSQTGLFKGTAAAMASDDLEQTLGRKVFAQANDLRQLQATMRSYIVQDIGAQINSIKHQIDLQEVHTERQQRAISRDSSVEKDRDAKIGAYSANILRAAELHIDGFTSRHSDAMNIAGATVAVAGGVMAPVASTIGVAAQIGLSSDWAQDKIANEFDANLEEIGITKSSRQDLAKFAAEATAFGVSGISAAKLPSVVGKGVTIGKEFISNNQFRSPLTFKFNEGKLYSGLPLDAVKLHSPILVKSANVDFAPSGFLDAQLYPTEKLQILGRYLYKRGVDLYPVEYLPKGKQYPAFTSCYDKTGRPAVFLPRDATVLEVKHELSHYLDFRKFGREFYDKLSTYKKEQMVLDRLKNNSLWNDLTIDEQIFSERYVADELLKDLNKKPK